MPRLLAGLLVFFTSAAVLVLEIVAGRLLAPYVGMSLETYTGIIGTVLAGISLGSWLGGKAADRVDPRRLLGPLVTVGGVLALLSPTAVAALGEGVRGGDAADVVALAVAGFFTPAVVLSAVSPTVVKLQLRDLGETGAVVGRLAALGTAGAIAGTFATGFALVAMMPSRAIVLAVGGALVAAGVALTVTLRRAGRPTAAALVFALLAAGASAAATRPCEYESPYFCARVAEDPTRSGGRLLVLDNLRHSYVDLDDPTYLEFEYTRTVADVVATVAPPGAAIRALHVGGGGFTLPRYIAATRPGSTNVVLELDPAVLRVARAELGLETGPDLTVRVGDARTGIRELPTDAYDVAVGDAFGSLAVPWHLTTREFLVDVAERLRPGGVYAMNVIDYPPLRFLKAEATTFAEVFDHVALLAPRGRLAGREGGNFVLVGSDRPLDLQGVVEGSAGRGGNNAVLSGSALRAFTADATVLTDAYAPVDQLISRP